MRVLIVDDSVVFRSQIRAALEGVPNVEVAGTAGNGKIALARLEQGSVDLVTLDLEMPELDGLETIREIRKRGFPVKIIAFSAHTRSGSEKTFEALRAGADDFATKPQGEDVNIGNAAEKIRGQLIAKILQFKSNANTKPVPRPATVAAPAKESWAKKNLDTFLPAVIVIGSSTGGPPALEKVLKGLVAPLRVPILISQHMPPIFTETLARRLSNELKLPVEEAKDGALLRAGQVLIAPGDFHLVLQRRGDDVFTVLDRSPQRNSVRPSVDVMFESVVEIYRGRVMGVILTGMGDDGLLGCRAIKRAGGGVMIQDRESSVVFGMPGAVFTDGAHDDIGNLEAIQARLKQMT